MACPLKKHQILEVIDLTTDFVAKVLCPKFEEFGSAGGTEMIANVCATLETISDKVQNRQMRFLKKDGKWIYKELPGQRDDDDDDAEDEDDDDDGDDEHEDKMAKEADKLIKQIIKTCGEYAADDKERCANYASVVMTLLEIAPKGAKAMMAHAMMMQMTGELKL